MIEYQTCRTLINIVNIKDCDILHKNSSSNEAIRLQELVQPISGIIIILQSCIETIYPTILTFYIGPWSDKYGRKPVLYYALIGNKIIRF